MSIGGLQLFWITDTGLLGGPKNVRNMGKWEHVWMTQIEEDRRRGTKRL